MEADREATVMRLGIIGTNFISDRLCEALAQVEGIEAYAVYSRRTDTGEAFAEKYGIGKVYCDLDEMLADDRLDAVYVASPTFCHAEQAIRAMRAGKHVLCEKMMAATLDEFYGMKECSEQTGMVLLEAMRPAHDPIYDVIRSYLPRLGKIRRATLEFCQYSSRYDRFKDGILTNAFDPSLKNTALSDIGIYPLHVALLFFGKPLSVSGSSVFLENGFEGAGALTLTYQDMIAGVVYSKVSDSVNPSVIEGELGSLTINKISAPTALTLYLRGEAPIEIPLTPAANNMIYELAAFRDMVDGVREYHSYLELTEQAQTVVDEIYRSVGIDKFF